MGHSTLRHLLRALAVTLLGASSCSATLRTLKTNTHCILANGNPLCPGEGYRFDSDFVTIAAGFPDDSKILKTYKPYWEETLWIGSHSILTLPGFDKSMKDIFLGEDYCLYGNVGQWGVNIFPQLIKCVNQRYPGKPYPNPWATKNYGNLVEQALIDVSPPAHNDRGASAMDYRKLPQAQGDPNNELPAYNGLNPLLRGKHQDSQWGIPDVDYPSSQPPIYDTTAPPLSYPVKKIRPIRPFPAPGVPIQKMPNVHDLPAFLPPCPKYKPNCNKRKSPEQIRKEGSIASPNTNVAMTDPSVEPTPGAAATTTDGNAAAGGGDTTTTTTDTESGSFDSTVPAAGTTGTPTEGTSMATTDGTTNVASTDDTPFAQTDGTAAPTDGLTTSTDTTVASLPSIDTTTINTDNQDPTAQTVVAPTDGIVAPTDSLTTSTDTTAASLPSIDTTAITTTDSDNQDLIAQTVPSDSSLFGKKSRRAFPHPRDFHVQMR